MAPGAPRLPVGGPMSAHGANVLEAKRKKFKSLVDLLSPSQYLSYLLCFDNDHPRGLFGARNGQKANFHFWGPFWPPLSPGEGREGPTGFQNTSTHCAWVGRIHIRCLGPLTDFYGTPRDPKRARLGLERPFWGPRRASECPGGPVFGPTVTGWSNGMTRTHIMCLGP